MRLDILCWGHGDLRKSEVIRDYNATAGLYDSRYWEEQSLKICFMMKRVRPKEGDAVVDVGCGTGLLLKQLGEGGLHLGIDASIEMLAEARRRETGADLVLCDAESLPLREGCCDAVYSVSLLQLLDSPERGIAEMLRVLRKGGSYAFSILLKSGKARFIAESLRGPGAEACESESMKDLFLFGQKPK